MDKHKKECSNHYVNNKDYYKKRNDKRKELFIQRIREAKDVPCTDCGNKYPFYVMEFDHLPQFVKKFNIASIGLISSMKALDEEIDKCEVVCANCHKARTYLRLIS